MAAIGLEYIHSKSGDAGHRLFVEIQFAGEEAAFMSFIPPRWMRAVAEDQLAADAGDFAGGLCGLRVAEVAEELHGSCEAFSDDGIIAAARFQLKYVENLVARSKQPAERVSQGKCYALALPVIQLAAVGVSGSLQVVQRPNPEVHCRSKSAGTGAWVIGGDRAHLGCPRAELGKKYIAGHGDR